MSYFFLPAFGARWLRALAAAVRDALLERPSRSTFDAADAAVALVFRPFAIPDLLDGEGYYRLPTRPIIPVRRLKIPQIN